MNEMDYIVLAILGAVVVLVGIFCLADYIVSSLGLMKLAQRREINNSWLVWFPVGRDYITGAIVDEYEMRLGLKRQWRTILTAIYAVSLVSVILYITELARFSAALESFKQGVLTITFFRVYALVILAGLASALAKGCGMVCMYKIYESTVPEKSVRYFIISLVVPLAQAICLYFCSDKDGNDNAEIEVEVFEVPAEEK